MIGILDRDPDGCSLYIIICLIQDRSSPAVKNGLFSNPAPLQANPSVGMIFHMPCMHMSRIFKETFGTGKRSDAVRSLSDGVCTWSLRACFGGCDQIFSRSGSKIRRSGPTLSVPWVMVSAFDRCKRALVAVIKSLAALEVKFAASPFRKFLEF